MAFGIGRALKKAVGLGSGGLLGGLLLGPVGLGLGYMYDQGRSEQKKAQRAQNEANRISSNQQKIQQLSQRRNEARANAMARAQMNAIAAGTGGLGSSGLAGAMGASVTSDAASQGALQGAFATSDVVSALSEKVAKHSTNAAMWQQGQGLLIQGAGIGLSLMG